MLTLLCTLVVQVIHCISCISSFPTYQPPAYHILIMPTYAARRAFPTHFILQVLHALLSKISLCVAFILNYIHILDIVS